MAKQKATLVSKDKACPSCHHRGVIITAFQPFGWREMQCDRCGNTWMDGKTGGYRDPERNPRRSWR